MNAEERDRNGERVRKKNRYKNQNGNKICSRMKTKEQKKKKHEEK